MNYIVFDLEFNQGYSPVKGDKSVINKNCPFEIIQLGAVKLNENLDTISTLERLIKPKVYPILHPFVADLTGLTIKDLNAAEPFQKVYEEFIEFLKGDKSILCTWGMADIKELFRNILYYKLDTFHIPNEYIDLQSYASKHLNRRKGFSIGLGAAVALLEIPFKEEFHDALADACYTTEVFRKIHNKKVEPKICLLHKNRRENTHRKEKCTIDNHGLIKQFEKMFNREMTEDEKSIIKLAYIMGRTNQFQIKNYDK
ncbi:exonuclease [Clostridium bovifaecis]|uniref:Exonuclease n=1 Tax=Clostridium bovifaecis TaxID=2184719 RepID=A0A6I6F2L2_9CLOT|nr:exonuclease [Clostridium bovifaecis]